MADATSLKERFVALYTSTPSLYRAPGRVNLIGEHTDYNQGWAMPAALQFDTILAIAPNNAPRLRVRAHVFDETVDVPLHDRDSLRASQPRSHWSDYVVGVVLELWDLGVAIEGADLLIDSDIPLGSGLSSSASFEVCVALALSDMAHVPLEKLVLAKLCQAAENNFVGMRCGIMDQFASVFGRRQHALMLDCRSLEHREVTLADSAVSSAHVPVSLVVCNTMVRHTHAGGEYNRRRAECEQAVHYLSLAMPGTQSLRDVSLDELTLHGRDMDPLIWRRAHHVISENDRVIRAAYALQFGDAVAFGELLRASHSSLRDDYEVSCAELDAMVAIADGIEGVFGSRMTGGGFGGCTVSWLRTDAVDEFTRQVQRRYAAVSGRDPEIYVCATADGAGRLGA